MKLPLDKVDDLAVSALRSLVIDETNHANSGHPGMALDIAPAMYLLYRNHLVASPSDPLFFSRDRFVLSAGHVSALLYALLHVFGYGLTMDDLKGFRSFGSLTPGHPEFGLTKGVDATAGPLGQGISQAVGMAMAERSIAHSYPEGERLCSHFTYCLCGDGCLEEGLGQEAISLAGHLGLEKLILIYDRNGSTLDGPTSNSLSECEKKRFEAEEWRVLEVKDGNDLKRIDEALSEARKLSGKPTLIIIDTVIGFGSENAGSHKTHGSPLGLEDGLHAKKAYGYDYPEFTVPAEVYDRAKDTFAKRGEKALADYRSDLIEYQISHPGEFGVFEKSLTRDLSDHLPKTPDTLNLPGEASRKSSGRIVASLPSLYPFTLGGSADVAGSVMTAIPGDPGFSKDHYEAKNVNFGIREFAMAGAQNGMLLHGGIVSYVGCFLIFSDYMKSAIRMSALEHLPAIYLFSHDSVAVGEDGPTHEPIEQLAALREIPFLEVFRPADEKETYEAWRQALLSKDHPTALILSRQTLPSLERSSAEGVDCGGYLLTDAAEKADIEIIATGSEVSLALDVRSILLTKGITAAVASFPSSKRFDEMGKDYQEKTLYVPYENRFSLEMSSDGGWYKYAKHVIGLTRFGYSAKASDVLKAVGFTKEQMAERILIAIGK